MRMEEIKLSEKYIRDKLEEAVKLKKYWESAGDRYNEGICKGKIMIYKHLLSEIKQGVDDII